MSKMRIGICAIAIMAVAGCGGSPGPAGAAGAAGAQGLAGATDSVSRVVYCSKVDAGIGASLLYEYQVSVFASGDVFVSCVLGGANGQSSASEVYRSTQVGAATAGCSVIADVNNDNASGFWVFQISGATASVTYHDSGQAHDGYSYTFAAGECATH